LKERGLEFKERVKKPWCTEVRLRPRSIGSAIEPPFLASEFPQIACLAAIMGSELFISFPREKTSLTP
jgi:hypothetical protein